jgi:hypothetical protein
LVWSVNEKNHIVPSFEIPVPGNDGVLDPEEIAKIADMMWDNPRWIEEFIDDKAKTLEPLEKAILFSWRENFVKSNFFIVKHLKNYSVFLSGEKDPKLYGVIGISDSIENTFPFISLPIILKTVLLPFKESIIYHSLFELRNVSFGPGIRASLARQYKEIKEVDGVILTLPHNRVISPSPSKTSPPKSSKSLSPPSPENVSIIGDENVPKALVQRYNEIADYISRFCDDHLNDDLKRLCLRALAKLARKRQSPIINGQAKVWAAGVTYAICQINFAFDKAQPYFLTRETFHNWFIIPKNTIASKGRDVRTLLDLSYFSEEFTLKPFFRVPPLFF